MGYALFLVPCSNFWACPDTPQLVALEQRELMPMLRELYHQTKSAPDYRDRLPEPLRVRVSQKEATLITREPMSEISLEYAEVWYRVYNRNHPGTGTVVYFNVVWPSGSLKQYFPITTLRITPPRDVRERVAATS